VFSVRTEVGFEGLNEALEKQREKIKLESSEGLRVTADEKTNLEGGKCTEAKLQALEDKFDGMTLKLDAILHLVAEL
jgi:hypothetical protein